MNSWATLTALGDDIDSDLQANYGGTVPYIVEHDYDTIEALGDRKDIPGIRIGLFEQPEEILTRVEANSAYDLNQAYLMQLFFVVARIGDYDSIVEQELMRFKDHVYDWSYNIDAGSVTSNELLTFEWDSISRIERRDDYSLIEINFGSYRQTRL